MAQEMQKSGKSGIRRMAKKPTKPDENLTDSIKRALEAASTATDSAEEAASVSEAAEKALLSAAAAQKKVVAMAAGTVTAALICGALGALVYIRSVEDLRLASEIQSAANQALIERIQNMTDLLDKAEATLAANQTLSDEIGARFDGLGDRISAEIGQLSKEAVAMQPQMANALQKHIDDGLETTRGAILTALAEMELGGSSAADPGMKALLEDIRSQLAAQKTAKATSAAAKPASKPKARTSAAKATDSSATKSPYTYP